MTKPKSKGGLGLVPIEVRNEALLCKWGWHFGKEVNALWIRVLMGKYGASNVNGWSLGEEVDKSGSQVLKAWWRLCQGRSEVGDFFRSRLRLLVGKGNRTFLWEDLWLGDKTLKERFPRLFRAARIKMALVKEVFRVSSSGVSWHFDFRRELRGFEEDSLNELKAQLGVFSMDLESDDELVWMGDSSGIFSLKSLIQLASQNVTG